MPGQDNLIIDWNEVWKKGILDNQRIWNGRDCADYWSDSAQARQFDVKAKRDDWKKARETIRKIQVNPGSRVLDIGSGPGTLAIPLSEMVESVTAVEPSRPMFEILNNNIKNDNINNIKCIPKRWEDVDIKKDLDAPYDVVISSFSLGMADLKAALKKMDEASSRYVYIYWFAGSQFWERILIGIWESSFSGRYTVRPQINCVYNLLYDMGIYANVEIYPEVNEYAYSSLEEAVKDIGYSFNFSTNEHEEILADHVSRALIKENERLVLRGTSFYARLWWDKENRA